MKEEFVRENEKYSKLHPHLQPALRDPVPRVTLRYLLSAEADDFLLCVLQLRVFLQPLQVGVTTFVTKVVIGESRSASEGLIPFFPYLLTHSVIGQRVLNFLFLRKKKEMRSSPLHLCDSKWRKSRVLTDE